jgi:hypothetical protein
MSGVNTGFLSVLGYPVQLTTVAATISVGRFLDTTTTGNSVPGSPSYPDTETVPNILQLDWLQKFQERSSIRRNYEFAKATHPILQLGRVFWQYKLKAQTRRISGAAQVAGFLVHEARGNPLRGWNSAVWDLMFIG